VADDAPAIAMFVADRPPVAGKLIVLDEEPLPVDPAERKAVKPDLESLCLLPDEVLFTLGSGATERRDRGWLLPLAGGAPAEVSLRDLYAALRAVLPDLNIEGAAIARERLWLAQRGNGHDGENVLIELDLAAARGDLRAHRRIDPAAILTLGRHDLGDAEGVPLTFSDLCPLPDGRLVFCAVAETGESTYLDGECVGAALGVLGADGVQSLHPLAEPFKIEGASLAASGSAGVELLLVTDADDPDRPALLLAGRIALPPYRER
jgi:hypothetical protein